MVSSTLNSAVTEFQGFFTCNFHMWPLWVNGERGVLWVANLLSVGADHELIVSEEQLVCSFSSDRSYFFKKFYQTSHTRELQIPTSL